MKPKIVLNENPETVKTVKKGLKAKGGHCPCRMERGEDTKCICKGSVSKQPTLILRAVASASCIINLKVRKINMPVVNVNEELFESKIKTSADKVLIDFYADWRGPLQNDSPYSPRNRGGIPKPHYRQNKC